MFIGFAFFNKEVPGIVPRHLNVVIGEQGNTFLVVNVTTGGEGEGLLFAHSHWYKIEKPSRLAASQARLVTTEQLRQLQTRHLWQVTEGPCEHTVLLLQAEFLRSERGKESLKWFLRKSLRAV